jgi:hypothetical protein
LLCFSGSYIHSRYSCKVDRSHDMIRSSDFWIPCCRDSFGQCFGPPLHCSHRPRADFSLELQWPLQQLPHALLWRIRRLVFLGNLTVRFDPFALTNRPRPGRKKSLSSMSKL